MLGMAFGQSMAPVIDELYETKEDKAAALQRHITLFNTESQVGSICNGIAIGMEEQLANGNGSAESIQEAKVALIGPTPRSETLSGSRPLSPCCSPSACPSPAPSPALHGSALCCT